MCFHIILSFENQMPTVVYTEKNLGIELLASKEK